MLQNHCQRPVAIAPSAWWQPWNDTVCVGGDMVDLAWHLLTSCVWQLAWSTYICIVSVRPCMHAWAVLHACHVMMCGSSVIYCISSVVSTWWRRSPFLRVRHTGRSHQKTTRPCQLDCDWLQTEKELFAAYMLKLLTVKVLLQFFRRGNFGLPRSHGLKF